MNLSILKNRYIQLGASFIIGGIVTVLLMPQITKTKIETQIVEKEVVVTKEIIKEIKVDSEKSKSEKIKVVRQKEIRADGTVIEYELYESELEQLERVKREEKDKYALALAQKESEFKKREEELKFNADAKKFTLYGGYIGEQRFLIGTSYRIWGPMSVGIAVNSNKDVSILPTLGVTF